MINNTEFFIKGMNESGCLEVIDKSKNIHIAKHLTKLYAKEFGPSWVIWYEQQYCNSVDNEYILPR